MSEHDCQIWFDSSQSQRNPRTYAPGVMPFRIMTRSTISRLYGPHSEVHEYAFPILSSPASTQYGWNPSPVWNWFEPLPQLPCLSRQVRGIGFFRHCDPGGEVPTDTCDALNRRIFPPRPPH